MAPAFAFFALLKRRLCSTKITISSVLGAFLYPTYPPTHRRKIFRFRSVRNMTTFFRRALVAIFRMLREQFGDLGHWDEQPSTSFDKKSEPVALIEPNRVVVLGVDDEGVGRDLVP